MDLESEKQSNQTPIENFETADNSNQDQHRHRLRYKTLILPDQRF